MNLRKDHYRRARPSPRGQARKTTTCRGASSGAHPKASQTQRAERRAGGGPADSQCLVPSLTAGSVRSSAAAVRPARRSVSFFLSPVFPESRRAPAPASGDSARNESNADPSRRRGRVAPRVPIQLARPSSGGRRGVQCPREGRPGVPSPRTQLFSNKNFCEAELDKNQKRV